jgi:DNA-binding response OmpR family regulator
MRRVLVVEDEAFIIMLLADLLVDLGFEPILLATVDDGVSAANTADFRFAILDVNLGGSTSYPVADVLVARGVPFAFATGYGSGGIDGKYTGIPVLRKPIDRHKFGAVVQALDNASGKVAST